MSRRLRPAWVLLGDMTLCMLAVGTLPVFGIRRAVLATAVAGLALLIRETPMTARPAVVAA